MITIRQFIVAVAVALSFGLACIASDAISGFAFNVLFLTPFIFISRIREHDDNVWNVKMGVMLAMVYVELAAAYSLHFVYTAGYLAGGALYMWLELIRSTSQLYFLPLFFAFIRQRIGREIERDTVPPFVVTLPGGIVVGFTFMPGSLVDSVVRSNECRAAAYYYCSYLIHCACTLALAATAAWFEVIEAETSLIYLAVCSVVSIALCLPLAHYNNLNTRTYTDRVSWALVPTLAATFLLQAYGGVTLLRIGKCAVFTRSLIWNLVIPATGYANDDDDE